MKYDDFFSWRGAILKSDLPSGTRHVLLTLSCHMNDAGEGCYPSIKQLMSETGLSNRVVIQHLKRAAEAGWIIVRKHEFAGQKWARNDYKMAWPETLKGSDEKSPPSEKGGDESSSRNCEGGDFNDQKAVTNRHTSTSKNSSDAVVDDARARDPVGDPEKDRFHEVGKRVLGLMGVADSPNWLGDYGRVAQWLADGCDPELDIYPTVRRLMAKRDHDPPNTIKYFEKAIADARAARLKPMPKGKSHGNKSRKNQSDSTGGYEGMVEAAGRIIARKAMVRDEPGGG